MPNSLSAMLLLYVLSLGGCLDARARPARIDGQGLEGLWQAEFVGNDAQGVSQSVIGVVALYRSPWIQAERGITDTVHLQGVFDVDFRALGFDARIGERIPPASADMEASGYYVIRLSPYVSQGGVVAQVRLEGDSLVGEWYREYPSGPRGTVTLLRR